MIDDNDDVIVVVAKLVGYVRCKCDTKTVEAQPTLTSHDDVVAPNPSPSTITPSHFANEVSLLPSFLILYALNVC